MRTRAAAVILALAGAMSSASSAWTAGLPEQVVMIRKSSGVQLETTVYRPEGPGPFPLVVINHGKAPIITPARQPRARYSNAAREFLSRGFVVAIPMRQGFSKSTGAYRGQGCEVEVNGRAQADDVEATLDGMAAGGMYDLVGGGFHRYSVDERWLVPHFEKMLYDNALLVPAYLHGWLVTGKERYWGIGRAHV